MLATCNATNNSDDIYYLCIDRSAVLLLLQLWVILSRRQLIEGVVSDVYGSMRTHRLSLVLNRHGAVASISCVPCGLLHDVTNEGQAVHDDDDEQTTLTETRENQYTKVSTFIQQHDQLQSSR